MKNLHRALNTSKQKVKRLQVDQLVEEQSIHLQENDAVDISHIDAEVSPDVEDQFSPDCPQRIL